MHILGFRIMCVFIGIIRCVWVFWNVAWLVLRGSRDAKIPRRVWCYCKLSSFVCDGRAWRKGRACSCVFFVVGRLVSRYRLAWYVYAELQCGSIRDLFVPLYSISIGHAIQGHVRHQRIQTVNSWHASLRGCCRFWKRSSIPSGGVCLLDFYNTYTSSRCFLISLAAFGSVVFCSFLFSSGNSVLCFVFRRFECFGCCSLGDVCSGCVEDKGWMDVVVWDWWAFSLVWAGHVLEDGCHGSPLCVVAVDFWEEVASIPVLVFPLAWYLFFPAGCCSVLCARYCSRLDLHVCCCCCCLGCFPLGDDVFGHGEDRRRRDVLVRDWLTFILAWPEQTLEGGRRGMPLDVVAVGFEAGVASLSMVVVPDVWFQGGFIFAGFGLFRLLVFVFVWLFWLSFSFFSGCFSSAFPHGVSFSLSRVIVRFGLSTIEVHLHFLRLLT